MGESNCRFVLRLWYWYAYYWRCTIKFCLEQFLGVTYIVQQQHSLLNTYTFIRQRIWGATNTAGSMCWYEAAGPGALPLGCTDLDITTSDAQVTVDSGIDIYWVLTSNDTQAFITALVDQYPYRNVKIESTGSGNIVENSLFTMGTIDLKSLNGHVTMTNSFGDGVTVETTDKSIQILDLGGVSLDLLNPAKPGFKYDYINVKLSNDVFLKFSCSAPWRYRHIMTRSALPLKF